MPYLSVPNAGSKQTVDLYYEDWGQGAPVVLIHGWPLDHQMWEYQSVYLASQGLRVIAYDRRGFGKSSQPWTGYDYDTLAADLKALLDALELQNVTLVGFSMGGGEVARYMSQYSGDGRVTKVAFVAAVPPYLLKTDDNPEGVDASVFQQMLDGLNKDRADFLNEFGKKFYGSAALGMGVAVSAAQAQWTLSMAMPASPKATLDCVNAFAATDFRQDLPAIHVPALVIHGDNDQTVPIAVSGARTAEMLPHAQYLVYPGAPHGLHLLNKDRLNADLLAFASGTTPVDAARA